jgi:SagB-type dehydrogenase family enzyme
VRNFSPESLRLAGLGQVLWAAQGRTAGGGGRTAPSAGATYPLELYVAPARVRGLAPALYRYESGGHLLRLVRDDDIRVRLATAAYGQACLRGAAAVLVLSAEDSRTTARYGERGLRYADMEAGHVGQNIHLECTALGLGTVMVGAFCDDSVSRLLGTGERPLYLIPVGRPQGN